LHFETGAASMRAYLLLTVASLSRVRTEVEAGMENEGEYRGYRNREPRHRKSAFTDDDSSNATD